MKITFLDVGEACDPQYPNTSILLQTDNRSTAQYTLIDCGFTTPHSYFKLCSDSEQLDALWISHFHGDHFFGVPLLLLRFWEMGRVKPLLILGQQGIEEKICQALELAYPGFKVKLNYPIEFRVVEPGHDVEALDFIWKTAESEHSQKCLALRLDATNGKSIFYSGDGRPTQATLALAHGCNLAIHEAFGMENKIPGHGSIRGCLDFARNAEIENLALVHLQRDVRQKQQNEIQQIIGGINGFNVFLPEAGDVFMV